MFCNSPYVFWPPPFDESFVLVFVLAHEQGDWRIDDVGGEVEHHFDCRTKINWQKVMILMND
jgi:hypothetical protein